MCELPVGGGAGVQDVLFGSEQRQIVGIKVDLSCVHDGKSFQTSAVWLSSLVPTVSGGGCWWVGSSAEEKKKKKQPQRSVGSRPSSSEALQVHAERWGGGDLSSEAAVRSAQELRTHRRRLRLHSASWCSGVELFTKKRAPPPVERVESVMTTLAG